jgi:hypothetical protein
MLFVYLMLFTVLYNFTHESIADALVHRHMKKGLRNSTQPLHPLHMEVIKAPVCNSWDSIRFLSHLLANSAKMRL